MDCKITCRKFNRNQKQIIRNDNNTSPLNTNQNIIINNQLISNSSSKEFFEQKNKYIIEKGKNYIKNKFKKDELKINLFPKNIRQG